LAVCPAGGRTLNIVPAIDDDETAMVPSCALTISRTMKSPRPRSPGLLSPFWKGS